MGDVKDCTCASSLTREQALKRLSECKALPVGERGASVNLVRAPRHVMQHWQRLVTLSTRVSRTFSNREESRAEWRRWAFPLRKAREERKTARMYQAIMQKQRDNMGDELDARIQAAHELQEQWNWCVDELMRRDVGAALLDFFTWLAVISRKTTAPCPFCWSSQEVRQLPVSGLVVCNTCGAQGNTDQNPEECLRYWNEAAVPLAFERAKEKA